MPGGLDLTPLPGRYLTSPSNTSVVSVRLGGVSTALCSAPNWDQLLIGCFAVDELENSTSSTTTWAGSMALEKCSRACAGSAALYTSGDTCGCLEAKPMASTHHPAYFCNQPCSADASQLCGASAQVCATEVLQLPEGCDPNVPGDCVCPSYMLPASVYHLPSTLSTSPGGNNSGACSFTRASAHTPILEAVSPRTAAFNASLELRGTGFLSSDMLDMVGRETRCDAWCAAAAEVNADGAPKAWDQRCFRESALAPGVYPCAACPECGPTVTVCGGQDCAVEFYNETYVRCRMPMCSAAANESTRLHVLTVGYAAAPSSTSVAGALQVASVVTAGASGVASGSAAGGRVLTITGEGFDDEAARMQALVRVRVRVTVRVRVRVRVRVGVRVSFGLTRPHACRRWLGSGSGLALGSGLGLGLALALGLGLGLARPQQPLAGAPAFEWRRHPRSMPSDQLEQRTRQPNLPRRARWLSAIRRGHAVQP